MPRLVVGIPTAGRPAIVAQTVRHIARQGRLPDLVLLSVSDPAHSGGVETEDLPFPVQVVTGPKGLSLQRNAILDRLGAEDILMFLDDDFLMAPDYLAQMLEIFARHPEVVLATGTVIADGILGPGLTFAEGEALLAEALRSPVAAGLRPVDNGYGCNMAIRAGAVLSRGIRFDEKLPLYSWLEDVDFSYQLAPHGRFVQAAQTRGVHLGTKSGRTPGLNLGYSQIVNPVYMWRKGTLPLGRLARLVVRALGSNLVNTLRPRPWADYRGRLIGNLLALWDILRGKADPQRILTFVRDRSYHDGRWRKLVP